MLNFPPWKVVLILLVCVAGAVFAFPNLLSKEDAAALPGFLPKNQINLGLDLQGGDHMLLEVGVQAVFDERLKDLRSRVAPTLREAGIRRFSRPQINGDIVRTTITNTDDVQAARDALEEELATQIDTGIGIPVLDLDVGVSGRTITLQYTEEALAARQAQVVQQAEEVIRRRVDEFGTREPTIQRQGTDRILVQIPGGGRARRCGGSIRISARA